LYSFLWGFAYYDVFYFSYCDERAGKVSNFSFFVYDKDRFFTRSK